MHAQLITYQLRGITHDIAREDFFRPLVKYFTELDSLVSKVWLNDESSSSYGGFYVWRDKKAFDDFMESRAAAEFMGSPYVVEITSADWPIDEQASRATRGIVGPSVSRT